MRRAIFTGDIESGVKREYRLREASVPPRREINYRLFLPGDVSHSCILLASEFASGLPNGRSFLAVSLARAPL